MSALQAIFLWDETWDNKNLIVHYSYEELFCLEKIIIRYLWIHAILILEVSKLFITQMKGNGVNCSEGEKYKSYIKYEDTFEPREETVALV